jgi:hypothetical protein
VCADASDLCLDFTLTRDQFGARTIVALKGAEGSAESLEEVRSTLV